MWRNDVLYIYTDGSCLPNPRSGGFGIVLVYTDQETGEEIIKGYGSPSYSGATSQKMELKACIEALDFALKFDGLERFTKIIIRSDSKYIIDNVGNAKFLWWKNKWRTRSGGPVLNVDLWKDLLRSLMKFRRQVAFEWVKGHGKDEHNRVADTLASASARNPVRERLSVVSVRRKHSPEKTRIGSVGVRGQRVSIRIIQTEYLKQHRVFRYRYEIISKGSEFF